MPRYFVNQIYKNKFYIIEEDAFHLKKVLRSQVKDKIEVVFNYQVYLCEIESITIKKVAVKILNLNNNSSELKVKINLFLGFLKKDKFKMIIQKATELGVNSITPIIMERSVSKIHSQKAKLKIIKWKMIAKNAAQQSKREVIPTINNFIKLTQILTSRNSLNIAAYEMINYDVLTFKTALKSYQGDTINIVVGPEGGISPQEVQLLKTKGFVLVGLGKRILRAETAPLMILSSIIYEIELKGE